IEKNTTNSNEMKSKKNTAKSKLDRKCSMSGSVDNG
nr:hypothetical protein [Tanacetum cinerariifolium]